MYSIIVGNNIKFSFPNFETTYAFMISKKFRIEYNKQKLIQSISIVEYYEGVIKSQTIYSSLEDFYMHRISRYIVY